MSPVKEHVRLMCAPECEGCRICEEDLYVCSVCGGSETSLSLTTHCPGVPLRYHDIDPIRRGHLDFRDGRWLVGAQMVRKQENDRMTRYADPESLNRINNSTIGFTHWHYRAPHGASMREVVADGYFSSASFMLREGDLITVNTTEGKYTSTAQLGVTRVYDDGTVAVSLLVSSSDVDDPVYTTVDDLVGWLETLPQDAKLTFLTSDGHRPRVLGVYADDEVDEDNATEVFIRLTSPGD